MPQSFLFPPETLFPESLNKYQQLFALLDLSSLETATEVGRNPISHAALVRALIYKNLRSLPTLSELTVELNERPSLAVLLGFTPRHTSIPVERFSVLLRTTENQVLQQVREALVQKLIQRRIINGKYLSFDACPIPAPVKQNNLKTSVAERFNKEQLPPHDPECRLGVLTTFPAGAKKVTFFWGYRNHVLNDAVTELPLMEITLPANVKGCSVAIPQLRAFQQQFALTPKAIMGDAEYDTAALVEVIVNELHAKPRIAKNPRAGGTTPVPLSPTGAPLCIAGFEMSSRGISWDKSQHRQRHKFICPIRASKRFAVGHPYCPWFHPQFLKGSGCYKNLRVDLDETIRQRIDYGSRSFKKDYSKRTSSERIFSRLLALAMQKPTATGLNATANLCTIAHITVLAVAYLATTCNASDKIRFVKSFIPKL
jgi:hypothetical protein